MVSKQSNKRLSLARKQRYMLTTFLFAGIGIALIGYGLIQIYDWRKATTASNAPPSQTVFTEDTPEPSENKPVDDSYEVPADQPRKIIMPSISSDGFIQKVGLTSKNAIAVPTNIHFAGWYTSSVKPGEVGLSVMDGHVSGRYTDGIFKNLGELNIGDRYSVQYGDKSERSFEIVEVKTLPESESARFLLTKNPNIERQLNLITCGGQFNNSSQTYQDRVVVVSKAV